jgi:alpha-tubulin suppressor-like RCC1 family protein
VVLTEDGHLYATGKGDFGRLGRGDTNDEVGIFGIFCWINWSLSSGKLTIFGILWDIPYLIYGKYWDIPTIIGKLT